MNTAAQSTNSARERNTQLQSVRLDRFNSSRQYNEDNLDTVLYPTRNLLQLKLFDEPDLMSVPAISMNKKVMTAQSVRRRPIDISTLDYNR